MVCRVVLVLALGGCDAPSVPPAPPPAARAPRRVELDPGRGDASRPAPVEPFGETAPSRARAGDPDVAQEIERIQAEAGLIRARTEEADAAARREAELTKARADLERAHATRARAEAERDWPPTGPYRPRAGGRHDHDEAAFFAGQRGDECDGCFFARMQRAQASAGYRLKRTEQSEAYASIAAEHEVAGCPGKTSD